MNSAFGATARAKPLTHSRSLAVAWVAAPDCMPPTSPSRTLQFQLLCLPRATRTQHVGVERSAPPAVIRSMLSFWSRLSLASPAMSSSPKLACARLQAQRGADVGARQLELAHGREIGIAARLERPAVDAGGLWPGTSSWFQRLEAERAADVQPAFCATTTVPNVASPARTLSESPKLPLPQGQTATTSRVADPPAGVTNVGGARSQGQSHHHFAASRPAPDLALNGQRAACRQRLNPSEPALTLASPRTTTPPSDAESLP